MATSSIDGVVKIWDIAGDQPKTIGSRNLKQGELFSMQFCQDIPWVLAAGGSKGEIAVWDCSENLDIENHFKPFLVKGTYDEADYNPEAVAEVADGNDEFEDVSDSEKKKKKKSKKNKSKK